MPVSNKLDDERSLVHKVVSYERIINVPNSMTYLPDMLPVAISMAKKRLTGLFNFTNPGTISHVEILELYIKVM
jgi:hypothetical protein